MAAYADEEEVWKCPIHPSKRRKTGICPICLRERLNSLCPDCLHVRPCACSPQPPPPETSTSNSSSFSLFSSLSRSVRVGSVGRMSNLIESEPAFRRSRSLAIPFFRSRLADETSSNKNNDKPPLPPGNKSRSSFLSVFRTHGKKQEGGVGGEEAKRKSEVETDEESLTMRRCRSVSIPVERDSMTGEARPSSATKSKGGWHFPSPIKAFRHSKASRLVQDRSPLYSRG